MFLAATVRERPPTSAPTLTLGASSTDRIPQRGTTGRVGCAHRVALALRPAFFLEFYGKEANRRDDRSQRQAR
jgi:hypothetical protein